MNVQVEPDTQMFRSRSACTPQISSDLPVPGDQGDTRPRTGDRDDDAAVRYALRLQTQPANDGEDGNGPRGDVKAAGK